jgi:hypothetical protein
MKGSLRRPGLSVQRIVGIGARGPIRIMNQLAQPQPVAMRPLEVRLRLLCGYRSPHHPALSWPGTHKRTERMACQRAAIADVLFA